MITLLKINILTDDPAVPAELREKVIALLSDLITDDPEGRDHARVSLEWRHTVHGREYMATLPPTIHAERIQLPKLTPAAQRARVRAPRTAITAESASRKRVRA